mmetsp:Transcript_26047/g.82684  ORF Transcript_26047/g.82684 Transcript_26047/m.82684 type:complete len:97 (-) Transcript_26047:1135-1425(-)
MTRTEPEANILLKIMTRTEPEANSSGGTRQRFPARHSVARWSNLAASQALRSERLRRRACLTSICISAQSTGIVLHQRAGALEPTVAPNHRLIKTP